MSVAADDRSGSMDDATAAGGEVDAQRCDTELDALATAANAGNHAAMERLLTVIGPPVLRYCRARLHGGAIGRRAPEDVARKVGLAVGAGLSRYQAGLPAFLAFVYRIARAQVDAMRRTGPHRWDPMLPETPGDGRLALRVDALRNVGALLDQLPPAQQEILVLRIAVGLSVAETARAVGSPAEDVRIAQHRALAGLRGLVGRGY